PLGFVHFLFSLSLWLGTIIGLAQLLNGYPSWRDSDHPSFVNALSTHLKFIQRNLYPLLFSKENNQWIMLTPLK
ncbi:MAG: hypothetical protein ACI9HY_000287, partial [Planctomycetaceae bacterium]